MKRERIHPDYEELNEGFQVSPNSKRLTNQGDLSTLQSFSSRVSHVMRNPLSGVLMNAQMMAEELPESSPLQVYLRDILEGAKTMEGTLQLLLEFTMPQAPKPRRFSLHEPAMEVIHWAKHRSDPQQVHVQAAYSPGLRKALADPGQVRNILLQIFRNAMESMPQGGEIRLTCSNIPHPQGADAQDSAVEIEILDTGTGIPKEDLPKVFEPFFTTRVKKIGLGLSIACLLCELNHGRIYLESREGKGTRVRIHLPAASATPIER
jgi:signal transduction histidine kinase